MEDIITTFTDNKRRTWNVAMDVTLFRKVLQKRNIDLSNIVLKEKISERFRDISTVADILFDLLEDQATSAKVDAEEFGRGLASGDVIDRASDCLIFAIANFSPAPKRELILKTWLGLKNVEKKALERATQELDPAKVEAMLDRELDKALGTLSAKRPQS